MEEGYDYFNPAKTLIVTNAVLHSIFQHVNYWSRFAKCDPQLRCIAREC